jgi:hypothetical protein
VSDLTIVTNSLADLVVKNGGNHLFSRQIPKYPVVERSTLGGKFNIAYIVPIKVMSPKRCCKCCEKIR